MRSRYMVAATLVAVLLPGLVLGTTDDRPDGTPKPIKVITDDSLGAFNYWSSDTVYNLQGLCFVEDGEVLLIEAGTVIKGNEGQWEEASLLVITQGGQIYAEGTICDPIIMTSILDDVDDPDDIPLDYLGRGLWGGLFIMGYAELPGADCPSNPVISTIPGLPPSDPRSEYGGCDDSDNSGVLKYISVRHSGADLSGGDSPGISMGSVGDGTVVDHAEVFFSLDDGFEWWGGTVTAYHLVAAFCGDDAFDFDEGYRGTGQFWFGINSSDAGDRSGEHDGTFGSELSWCPHTSAVVSNATYLGRGVEQVGSQRCFELRDNCSGAYYNSIFTDHGTYGLGVEDDPLGSTLENLKNGNLKFRNNVWYGFGNGNTSFVISNGVASVDSILFHTYDPCDYWLFDPPHPCPWGTDRDNHNYLSTTDIVNSTGSRLPDRSLDPRAANPGAWFCNDNALVWTWVDPFDPDDFVGYHPSISDPEECIDWEHYLGFEEVDYAGAFDPDLGQTWAHEWTALDQYGYLFGSLGVSACGCCALRGDIDHNGVGPDIADLVYLVGFMFQQPSPAPVCQYPAGYYAEADVDGNGNGPDIADLVYLVSYMFQQPAPAPAPCS